MDHRTIHITESDMLRLRELIGSSRAGHDRDRPYLSAVRSGLDGAVVLSPEEIAPDVVTMNSRVRLRDGRRTWVMTLVFPGLADPDEGNISVLAPLGAAMLGRRVGERVAFRAPDGETRACEIVGLLYQPEAAGDRHL